MLGRCFRVFARQKTRSRASNNIHEIKWCSHLNRLEWTSRRGETELPTTWIRQEQFFWLSPSHHLKVWNISMTILKRRESYNRIELPSYSSPPACFSPPQQRLVNASPGFKPLKVKLTGSKCYRQVFLSNISGLSKSPPVEKMFKTREADGRLKRSS